MPNFQSDRKNRLSFTQRDQELLLKLQNYGFLRTIHIADILFTNVALTTVLRRLRHLEKSRYIKRICLPEHGALAWGLTEKGANRVPDGAHKKRFRPDLLTHDLSLLDLRLKLEQSNIAGSWQSEHEIRSQAFKTQSSYRTPLVPDGIMGIYRPDGKRARVAIELELNFKNKTRYSDLFSSHCKDKEYDFVWYVTSNPAIGKFVLKEWKEAKRIALKIWGDFKKERSMPVFYWSILEDILSHPEGGNLYGETEDALLDTAWRYKPEPALGYAQWLSTLPVVSGPEESELCSWNPC
ncbi:MAG: replication-relaxation family protein [Bdellovibrionota bacterium]